MPGFRARTGSPAWLPSSCAPHPAGLECMQGALQGGGGPCTYTSGVRGSAALPMGLGGPQTASLPARPQAPQVRGCREHQPGLGPCPARKREEACRRMNNVVGCFADCQPHSRILLSTPLGLTATGPVRRGKSPLIWSWKEGGKVILRCLRRWVIGPQLLARTRAQCRVPPLGGGAGQRLAEAPRVVNKPAGSGTSVSGPLLCARWEGSWGGDPTGRGRGAAEEGRRAGNEENIAFFMR